MRRLVSIALVALVGLVALVARAASKLDEGTAEAFGGTYAVDCRKPESVHLRVAADALAIEAGTKRVVSHDVQKALTFMGQSPPTNYLGTLLGDIPGGAPLVFQAYRDAKGLYVVVDADASLEAAFGKTAVTGKFRSCEAATTRAPAPPPGKRPTPPGRAPAK